MMAAFRLAEELVPRVEDRHQPVPAAEKVDNKKEAAGNVLDKSVLGKGQRPI
jgi:hypothetical protein